jgi:hypothetical protein
MAKLIDWRRTLENWQIIFYILAAANKKGALGAPFNFI